MKAMTFQELGSKIWAANRERDAFVIQMLEYFSGPADKAYVCADDALGFNEAFSATYHALCGLGMLAPYIDRDGMECAKITDLGTDALKKVKA